MILQQKLKNVLGYNGSEGKQIKITRINFLATLEKKNRIQFATPPRG